MKDYIHHKHFLRVLSKHTLRFSTQKLVFIMYFWIIIIVYYRVSSSIIILVCLNFLMGKILTVEKDYRKIKQHHNLQAGVSFKHSLSCDIFLTKLIIKTKVIVIIDKFAIIHRRWIKNNFYCVESFSVV